MLSSLSAPNTYVSVTAVVSGVMQTATSQIAVPAPARVLNVEITPNKEAYRPGETATYLIVTKNSEGDGVPAEVSFGLVDESIYAVRPDTTPSIDKFFHGRNERAVSTNSFPITYYGGKQGRRGRGDAQKLRHCCVVPSVADANGHAVVGQDARLSLRGGPQLGPAALYSRWRSSEKVTVRPVNQARDSPLHHGRLRNSGGSYTTRRNGSAEYSSISRQRGNDRRPHLALGESACGRRPRWNGR